MNGQRVYVLVRADGLCKVGRSYRVGRRALEIWREHAQPVRVVYATAPSPDAHRIEFAAHRALLPRETEGEWFRVSPRAAKKAVADAWRSLRRGVDLPRTPVCKSSERGQIERVVQQHRWAQRKTS